MPTVLLAVLAGLFAAGDNPAALLSIVFVAGGDNFKRRVCRHRLRRRSAMRSGRVVLER